MKKINAYNVAKTGETTYRVNMVVKGADLFIDIDAHDKTVTDSSVTRGGKKESAMLRAGLEAISEYFGK